MSTSKRYLVPKYMFVYFVYYRYVESEKAKLTILYHPEHQSTIIRVNKISENSAVLTKVGVFKLLKKFVVFAANIRQFLIPK